jgi:hypothetical protein
MYELVDLPISKIFDSTMMTMTDSSEALLESQEPPPVYSLNLNSQATTITVPMEDSAIPQDLEKVLVVPSAPEEISESGEMPKVKIFVFRHSRGC